jgi:hypothetical protein
LPTISRNYFIKAYSNEISRKAWLDELNKGNNYWTELYEIKEDSDEEFTPYDSTLLSLIIPDTNNIAVLRIKSFDHCQIEKDAIRINDT